MFFNEHRDIQFIKSDHIFKIKKNNQNTKIPTARYNKQAAHMKLKTSVNQFLHTKQATFKNYFRRKWYAN